MEKNEDRPIVVRNTTDLQRLKLEKLMKNPDKLVIIPEKPKGRTMPPVPDFVRNVMGSSAGAGSGEFHVYRHLRRKEYARQKFIQEKSERERLDEEYHQRIEDNKKLSAEKTAKKRAKRQKKKQRSREKGKKKIKTESPSPEPTDSDDEDADDTQTVSDEPGDSNTNKMDEKEIVEGSENDKNINVDVQSDNQVKNLENENVINERSKEIVEGPMIKNKDELNENNDEKNEMNENNDKKDEMTENNDKKNETNENNDKKDEMTENNDKKDEMNENNDKKDEMNKNNDKKDETKEDEKEINNQNIS